MLKTVKWVSIGLGSIILLIVLFFAWYMIKAKAEINLMTPTESKVIDNNILSVHDSFTNLYLVKDSSQYLAIDAGNSPETVSAELKKLSVDPSKITALLLTHSDADHVAAISLFKNAKVFLSKQEEQMVNGKTSRFLFFGNKIDAREYSTIDDQQVITIGHLKIKGILTPGHTPGSMCYLVNDKYLFTGDALSLKNGKIAKFNEFFNMDTNTAVQSIANITQIPEAEYLFTAHYGYSDDYKNAVKEWNNDVPIPTAVPNK